MTGYAALRSTGLWLACLVMLASCNGASTMAAGGNGGPGSAVPDVYRLDVRHPTASQRLGPDVLAPESKKFVQVEVIRVSNPRRIGLSFTVQFRSAVGQDRQLGSFSLYPPDNPGRFIVATSGALRTGGTVTVRLVPLQPVGEGAGIEVWIKPLIFLSE